MRGIISQQKFNREGNLESIILHERTTRYRPNHPNATKRGAISKHRLDAADAFGKALPQGAVIHHHDGFFIICQDEKYHCLLHARTKALEVTGDSHKRRCSYCKQWDDPVELRGSAERGFHHLKCAAEYLRHLQNR